MKNKGVLYALCAGISWGISLGIFGRTMTSFGFTAMQVSAVRTTISAITFIILALVTDRKAFRLNPKDIWIFLCSGFISVTLFCWCYFTSTRLCSLAVGGVLQYTEARRPLPPGCARWQWAACFSILRRCGWWCFPPSSSRSLLQR